MEPRVFLFQFSVLTNDLPKGIEKQAVFSREQDAQHYMLEYLKDYINDFASDATIDMFYELFDADTKQLIDGLQYDEIADLVDYMRDGEFECTVTGMVVDDERE